MAQPTKNALSESQEKLLNVIEASDRPLSRKQLIQLTGLSYGTVRKQMPWLVEKRLVKQYFDGVRLAWTVHEGNVLPTINGHDINTWLRDWSTERFTPEFENKIKSAVAFLYLQPAYKIAAGKTLPEKLEKRRQELIQERKALDKAVVFLNTLIHELFISNDADFDNWVINKDYDPTLALTMSNAFNEDQIELILSKWRNKKVG